MTTDVRIVSVRQPWAWLIVRGIKGVENRTWQTDYRGPVLIHAGKRLHAEPVEQIERRFGIAIPRDLPRRGLVGIAHLGDVVRQSADPFFDGPMVINDKGRHVPNYGLVMRNAKPLHFMPCDGKLNLYRPDDALLHRLWGEPGWARELRAAGIGRQLDAFKQATA